MNLFRIKGDFNSYNTKGIILYKTLYPDFIEGEAHIGNLNAWNVKDKNPILLFDSIPTNIANAEFLTDSILLLPNNNNILAYDIYHKKNVGFIFNLTQHEGLLGFSLHKTGKIFATVLVNFENKRSDLILFNLTNEHKKSITIPFDFEDTEYYPEPKFFWVNDKIVFSLQKKIFLYNPNINKIAQITDSVESEFDNYRMSINNTSLLFRSNHILYDFEIETMIKKTIVNVPTDNKTEFHTANLNGIYKCYLLQKGSFFAYDKDYLHKVEQLPIVETPTMFVYKEMNSPDCFFVKVKQPR